MKVNCFCCGVSFNKTPSDIKRSKSGNHFCSKSCSAKINNRLFPKRNKEGLCVICGEPIPSALKYCKHCPNGEAYDTLEDVIKSHFKKYKTTNSNMYTIIRVRARTFIYSIKEKKCEKCGYDKHTEVCHKKPISKFDLSASIDNEINHIDNLLVLCPNCHWEFDHLK